MIKKREKVVLAMSGGVDSSVAACLLVEQGYDVMGFFMRTGVAEPDSPEAAGSSPRGSTGANVSPSEPSAERHRGCCSASDAADARFVAGMLSIPFYSLNFEQEFDHLIDYFADEYARGRTPNPCVVCNDRLKFGRIVEYADAVGARYIATGHYARIGSSSPQPPQAVPLPTESAWRTDTVLMRGIDKTKDQSYVLFGLDRTIIDRLIFPIGHLQKSAVRELAKRYQLPNRDKPDSVEICFAPDRDYARVVRERRPEAFTEGDVVDQAGEVVGRHKGIGGYTVGQRRGLGIAMGRPVYVTQLDVLGNTITIGDDEALFATTLTAGRARFLVDPPGRSFRAKVKIRYLHRARPATIDILDEPDGSLAGNENNGAATRFSETAVAQEKTCRVRVTFDEPQRAITPGQAVVFYDRDVVLGGAWIEQAEPIGHGAGCHCS